jgi:hypothetical protein
LVPAFTTSVSGRVFSTAREAVTEGKNTAAVNRKYRVLTAITGFVVSVFAVYRAVFITAPQR